MVVMVVLAGRVAEMLLLAVMLLGSSLSKLQINGRVRVFVGIVVA